MTVKIDKVGRIVLPKPARERLGLQAGMDLEMSEGPEGVTLKPVHRRPSLVREGRFLVHSGKLPHGYDIVKAIEEEREEHLRRLGGV
jgi:AbrB family looped-hinge helix DNA binding protein